MVNCSIYIFGVLSDGYTQYPDNYAKNIFQNFFTQSTSKSQIAIHRDKELMYYGYIRKLDDESRYIGFCVLINGLMFSNISNLFPLFENVTAEIVSRGNILGFNEHGDIVPTVGMLADKLQDVKTITSSIKNVIDGMEVFTKSLPPINYSISNTEKKFFGYPKIRKQSQWQSQLQ